MHAVVSTAIGGAITIAVLYLILQGKRAQHLQTLAGGLSQSFGKINRVAQGG